MGFLRKGLFVATGGLSGAAGVKANSKKERTAKALEKQNRLIKEQLKLENQMAAPEAAIKATVPRPPPPPGVSPFVWALTRARPPAGCVCRYFSVKGPQQRVPDRQCPIHKGE